MNQDTNPLAIKTFTLEEALKKIRSGLALSDDQLSEADLLKYGAKGKLEICAWISDNSPARCEIPGIDGLPTIEIKEVTKEFIDKRFKLKKNLWMDAETFNKCDSYPSSIKIDNPHLDEERPFLAIWDFRGLDNDENRNSYFNYQSVHYNLLIQINGSDLKNLGNI